MTVKNSHLLLFFFLFALGILVFLNPVFAESDGLVEPAEAEKIVPAELDLNTETLSASALICKARIERAKKLVAERRQDGRGTIRISDLILESETMYNSELLRELAGQEPDYSNAIEKAEEAITLLSLALQTEVELQELKETIAEFEGQIDTEIVIEIYLEGLEELNNQRYEFASQKVDEGYAKLLELQSLEARTSAVYNATSKGVTSFVMENRVILSLLFGIPLILFIIFKDNIRRYRLTSKINGLNFEINVLKQEIKNTQENYFTKGNISDSTYQIREKVYGQMVRNLNREIAVTNEEIEKTKRMKMRKLRKLFEAKNKVNKEKQ